MTLRALWLRLLSGIILSVKFIHVAARGSIFHGSVIFPRVWLHLSGLPILLSMGIWTVPSF